MSDKSVVIFGAGAVGGTIVAYMARAGHDVTVMDPWYAHILSIQQRGLHVTEPSREFTVKLRALQVDQVDLLPGPIDILFISVKSYDTRWVVRYMAPHLSPDGFVVSAQNSLNEEIIAEELGADRTMGLVVITSAGVFEPGKLIRYTTPGDRLEFQVGELDGRGTPRLAEVAGLLAAVGDTVTTDNIWGLLWSKLMHNCMANAVSGLTGMSSNAMYTDATVQKLLPRIGRECVLVADAYGMKLEPVYGAGPEHYRDLESGGEEVIRQGFLKEAALRSGAKDNPPSLLQDVMKGRRSEVDYLNGLLVRKGAAKGIPTPINHAVTEAMHRLDGGLLKPDPSNLELFREYL